MLFEIRIYVWPTVFDKGQYSMEKPKFRNLQLFHVYVSAVVLRRKDLYCTIQLQHLYGLLSTV